MAVIALEGFDHVSNLTLKNGWLVSIVPGGGGSSMLLDFPVGRLSGKAARMNAGANASGHTNTATITRPLPATYTTVFAGFAWLPAYNSSHTITETFFELQTAAGAPVCTLQANFTTGAITVLNAAGTLVATAVASFISGVWQYLELKAVVAGGSGSVTFRANGVIDANVNAVTANLGSTAVGQAQWIVTLNQSGAFYTSTVDDVYLLDSTGSAPRNTFLGDSRVETLYPVADGAHTDWTPDTGTAHWSRVNQTPPDDDTSYVADSTSGHRDTYQCGSLSTLVGAVFAVQTNLYARKDDAAARQIAPVIRKSGTDYDGATTAGLTTSYLHYSQLYNQDPSGTDWTISTVDTCEYGIKEVT